METFEEHYDSMCAAIARRMPTADMDLIDKAVHYADDKHRQQKRKDGSPYIIHPLAVAEIVVEMGLDMDAILGALLHDCIEDTDASHEEIEKLFGATVAELVEGVTKLTRANFSSTEEAQMENLRKMFMAMSKDIRVVLIKIADRLHNMRTMQYQSPAKQIIKCKETMDVYAPLAHRLGMQKMKWELEDTSLRYLAPKEYTEITGYLQEHKEKDEAFMQSIQFKITDRLNAMGIQNTTYGRIKHVYSIYRKMVSQDKTMDQLYDIYAFRVIVNSIPDCYNVLGHVHDLFNLVPGRFKVGDRPVILLRVDADQTRAAAAHQPAVAGNGGHLGVRVLGNLAAHAAVIHQAGKAEQPAGVADDASGLHIAAGAGVGAEAGEQQIVGKVRVKGHLDDGSAAPFGVVAAGKIQIAAGGGVHRLAEGRVHDQLLAAIVQRAVAILRAAAVGAAVEGILIFAPASGKIRDAVEVSLRQGEIPAVHIPAQNRLTLFFVQGLGVDVHGEGSQQQHGAEHQGQHFLKYTVSHRVQLLSHTAGVAVWYLHYT